MGDSVERREAGPPPLGPPPEHPPVSRRGGGGGGGGRAWLVAGAIIVVAAALAAAAVFAVTRNSKSPVAITTSTTSTTSTTATNFTGSAALTGDYKILASLIPPSIRKYCIWGPTEGHPGNLATANCPYIDSKHGRLSKLHIDYFVGAASAQQIYIHHALPGLKASGLTTDFKTPAGKCNGTELRGEGTWSHDMGAANAPTAGRVACYVDPTSGLPTIIWTYPAEHMFALVSGPSHGQLYAWWRFWAHEF
jgi:hypothetical protein